MLTIAAKIGFYAFGMIGLVIHVLMKVKDSEGNGSLLSAWKYVMQHQIGMVLAFATYTAIFWAWVSGAVPVLQGVSYWLCPVVAYSANSAWGHLAGIMKKKLSNS